MLVEHGAEVHAIDVAPIGIADVAPHHCDLGEEQSIDDVLGNLPETVDVLFNCAGVPNGGRFSPEEVLRINWLGLRQLTERVLDRMQSGAIVHVASTAGRGWVDRADLLDELVQLDTFDDGVQWIRAHLDECGDGYALSKEAVRYYTMWRGVQTVRQGCE